ncbi:MAG: DNA topoisomerase I [Bacteroidia bacterium]|nr:MAG: DNA topoisomerase I [Bacteroidia bacterium]
MSKNLVIVESPAKAETIKKFLGKDYEVKSCYGHIRDLVKKDFGIDKENNYAPQYEIMADKKKLVTELKKEVKKTPVIWLASDEDREGEAIAWHLFEVLNLKNKETKRITFNEITKEAITHSVENPREINLNLVNAQQARRVLDRLVGFELSSVLWKKVRPKLSAGRVQSVAVRMLVDREREILAFKPVSSFKMTASLSVDSKNGKNENFEADYTKDLKSEKEVMEILNSLQSPQFIVLNVEKKPGKKSPPPPFTTSSLQQEAGSKLGFPVGKTMRVAQRLYEAGYITYMRTDSVNLSKTARSGLKKLIESEFGSTYYKGRIYTSKTKNAQEAHEAIRPTYPEKETVDAASDEKRLYDLIRRRTIASQMSDAASEKTSVTIGIKDTEHLFKSSGEVITFPGFLKVYDSSFSDKILPPLQEGKALDLLQINALQQFTKHPGRYSEAALVKQLEKQSIGRPSTYAPIISTIQNRGYAIKESREGETRDTLYITYKTEKIERQILKKTYSAEKNKLFPTDIGMVVTDFLKENFETVLNFDFTANLEQEFDDIANGTLVWHKMIDNFYPGFHKKIDETLEHAERSSGERILGKDPKTGREILVRIGKFGPIVQAGHADDEEKPLFAGLKKEQHIETISLEEALELLATSGNGRLLGTDPATGKNVYARLARYGPVIQLGENQDTPKPKFAPILKGISISDITLSQALKMLELPREVGAYENKKILAAVGRFGPYIKHDSKFISLKKDDNPLTINLERAIELIEEKREKDRKNLIQDFGEKENIKIIKDRWGKPCIYHKKKYLRLSPKIDPATITLEECKKIIEKEMPAPKKKTKRKKK